MPLLLELLEAALGWDDFAMLNAAGRGGLVRKVGHNSARGTCRKQVPMLAGAECEVSDPTVSHIWPNSSAAMFAMRS
jgi:hypothetical protein